MQHAFPEVTLLLRRAVLQDVTSVQRQHQCRNISRNTGINKGLRQSRGGDRARRDGHQPYAADRNAPRPTQESAELSKADRQRRFPEKREFAGGKRPLPAWKTAVSEKKEKQRESDKELRRLEDDARRRPSRPVDETSIHGDSPSWAEGRRARNSEEKQVLDVEKGARTFYQRPTKQEQKDLDHLLRSKSLEFRKKYEQELLVTLRAADVRDRRKGAKSALGQLERDDRQTRMEPFQVRRLESTAPDRETPADEKPLPRWTDEKPGPQDVRAHMGRDMYNRWPFSASSPLTSDRAKRDLATSIDVHGEWTSSGALKKDLDKVFTIHSDDVRRRYEHVAVKMLRLDRTDNRTKSAQYRIARVAQQNEDASWKDGLTGQEPEEDVTISTPESSDLDALIQRTAVGHAVRAPAKLWGRQESSKRDRKVNDVWATNASMSQRSRSLEAAPSPYLPPRGEPRQRFEEPTDRQANDEEGLSERQQRRKRYKEQLLDRQETPEDLSSRQERPNDRRDRIPDRRDSFQPQRTKPNEGPDFTIQSIPYTTAASTFLYGRRSIDAALKARKRKAFNLYLLNTRNWRSVPEVADVMTLAESANVPIKYLSPPSLDALVRKTSRNAGESVDPVHDGICLETSPYPQLPVHHLGEWIQAKHTYGLALEPQSREDAAINGQPSHLSYHHDGWRHPFLLWLHGTVDMRNVGAIMRTCVYFGVDVILSARGTASAGFHKTSAGASEYLNLLRVGDAQTFIYESQRRKWRFYSAVAPGAVRNRDAPEKMVLAEELAVSPLAEGPCVLVLGNEDLGLPGAFVKMTDVGVGVGGRTKMAATAGVDSLNVGVAAALLIERFVRRPSQAEMMALEKSKEEKLF